MTLRLSCRSGWVKNGCEAVGMADQAETRVSVVELRRAAAGADRTSDGEVSALLVLDEPTQGLDELNRERILGFMSAIEARRHSTLLFVSHRQDEFSAAV